MINHAALIRVGIEAAVACIGIFLFLRTRTKGKASHGALADAKISDIPIVLKGGRPLRLLQFDVKLLFGLVAMFILGGIISFFDATTQIAPAQDGIENACMLAAGGVALLSATFGFWQRRDRVIKLRVMWAALLAMVGFGGSAFFFGEAASFVENWVDFPPGTTRVAEKTMPITYAYHYHSRRVSVWNIEVGDALFAIAPGDANFMLNHRLPGDTSGTLGQIWSGGYFCARMTIERAGNAERALHAGSDGLPAGSVVLCPKANGPLIRKAQQ